MKELNLALQKKLARLGRAVIDQDRARVLVQPTRDRDGYWFGGGNLSRDPGDDALLLIGRYRDAGDSRTGLAKGPRGRELAIFRSEDEGRTFDKILAWSKAQIGGASEVLSIEGSALIVRPRSVEVLVSSERRRAYPRGLSGYQKPGTGVWAIDRFRAPSLAALDAGVGVERLVTGEDPAYLHVKDPNVSPGFRRGQHLLLYCTHPYTWSSASSGYAALSARGCRNQTADFFARGPTWDVAATRITCRLPVPRLGAFASQPALSLYFYDGAECLRSHQAHRRAVDRPRGHSCEELGGLAYGYDAEFPRLHRLSRLEPAFVSPEGTGCSRYASVLADPDGGLFAIWQRSSRTRSQPLVGNRLTAARVARLLG